MSEPITHVVMITDMSGSMGPLADDVRGGFNQYIADLGKDAGGYRVTVTLFDNRIIPLCADVDPKDVPRLDARNYQPAGLTRLRDAIGLTVTAFEARTTLGDDDRVIVWIQTDGAENDSREYKQATIAELIRSRDARDNWSFMYVGAGPAAWGQADNLGIQRTNTTHSRSSSAATRTTYGGMAAATRAYSKGASGAETSDVLSAAIDAAGETGDPVD